MAGVLLWLLEEALPVIGAQRRRSIPLAARIATGSGEITLGPVKAALVGVVQYTSAASNDALGPPPH
jgi:hypothetical protein